MDNQTEQVQQKRSKYRHYHMNGRKGHSVMDI